MLIRYVDLSVERVAALAQENNLPVPSLDLSALAPSNSAFGQYDTEGTTAIRAPIPTRSYTTDDPWSIPKFPAAFPPAPAVNGDGSLINGAPSSISGTGLPKDWWRKQETVTVNILGQQGFILHRYLVYEVATDVRKCQVQYSVCGTEWFIAACSTRASSLFGICRPVGLPCATISFPPSATAAT